MDFQVAGFEMAQIATRHEDDDGEEYFLADEDAKFPARFSHCSILSFMC